MIDMSPRCGLLPVPDLVKPRFAIIFINRPTIDSLAGRRLTEITFLLQMGEIMTNTVLVRRKCLLQELGLTTLPARTSWSHDVVNFIVFDAWEHIWERDADGDLVRYPLRTNGQHYNLEQSRKIQRPGHTRWQNHVDLVVVGAKNPRAIVPVAKDPAASQIKGAKGWHPYFVEGRVQVDGHGQVWLHAEKIAPA